MEGARDPVELSHYISKYSGPDFPIGLLGFSVGPQDHEGLR